MNRIISFVISSFFLISCGGGGGGGSSAPTPAPTPSASVTLSANSTSINSGDEITLTWSSSNATSCSASGSWTGDKGLSGTEIVQSKSAGDLSFTITCSPTSGNSASKTVSITVNPIFNAYAFIDEPATYTGFIFTKLNGYAGCLRKLQVQMDVQDKDNLFIKQFAYTEGRFLGLFDDENGQYDNLGLRLGSDSVDNSAGYYIPLNNETFFVSSNQIRIKSNSTNPYTFEASTLDDFEQFAADIDLEFQSDYIDYCNQNLRMSLWAYPKDAADSNDSVFLGSSVSDTHYTILYLVDKRHEDEYASNLPSESDSFNINWAIANIFNSYGSLPNLEVLEDGIRVKSELGTFYNTDIYEGTTLNGSRLADWIKVNDNSLFLPNRRTLKYLLPDDSSSMRMFLKNNISSDCRASQNMFRDCTLSELELYFFTPDKTGMVGFNLGGYFGSPEQTNVKLLINNQ